MKKIWVIHGPNLNLLGQREPEIYGLGTLNDINTLLQQAGTSIELKCTQHNAEHEMVETIHQAMAHNVEGIVINPAAYTHTSIAIRDALAASGIPFVEVHLSNIFSRESFRQQSYFSDIAIGVISGFGAQGYVAALELLINQLESN